MRFACEAALVELVMKVVAAPLKEEEEMPEAAELTVKTQVHLV